MAGVDDSHSGMSERISPKMDAIPDKADFIEILPEPRLRQYYFDAMQHLL